MFTKRNEAELRQNLDKFESYFHLLNHWMTARHNGHSISERLSEMGLNRIAIYGMGYLAGHVFDDLENSGIEVLYGIDREICNSNSPIEEIYSPDDELPEADAVIVTAYPYFEEIKKNLRKKLDCPVISLENLVWSI